MAETRFDPDEPVIIVDVTIEGPKDPRVREKYLQPWTLGLPSQ